MIKTKFKVKPRKLMGKKVKKLRRESLLPGNVYGVGSDSISLRFAEVEFEKLYDEVGDTGLVYLQIEGQKSEKPTLISEVQLDPVSNQVQHVSFKEVNLTEKIQAEVPIETVGEFDVREAVLVQVKNSVEVEALPADLPEKFEVNLKDLTQIGQSITLADLSFDKAKIKLVEVETDEDWEKPVVLVQEQREEEVEVEAPVEEEVGAEAEKEGDGESIATKEPQVGDEKNEPEAKKSPRPQKAEKKD